MERTGASFKCRNVIVHNTNLFMVFLLANLLHIQKALTKIGSLLKDSAILTISFYGYKLSLLTLTTMLSVFKEVDSL